MLGLFAALNANANTYCAHTSFELNAALTDTSTGGIANDRANTIHVVSGTLSTSGGPFGFTTASGFALTLDGGYNSTCTTQDFTPGASMLDGGGAGRVLVMQTNGTLSVSHLTIQNASYGGSAGAGGQIFLSNAAAIVTFDGNMVRNNISTFAGGYTIFGTGTVHIDNNLFIGNSAPEAAALSTGMDAGSTIYFTNNTVVGNITTNTDVHNMTIAIGDGSDTTLAYVSNTISYGNTAAHDFYLYGSHVQFTNNDYASIDGNPTAGSSGNVNVDPKLVGAGDYHLQATSTLLDAGVLAPVGGLPPTDIEGHVRSYAGKIDLGAYQYGDGIFKDGFEG